MIDNAEMLRTGGFLKIGRLREEWYRDVENPPSLIEQLKCTKCCADLFTFWQRLPETKPKYDYYKERDSIAVLPIENFERWWNEQINTKTRNKVRKAEKSGVKVKLTEFNDEFVRGITGIFNETPKRQGKPFWHYGKDFETIKQEFSHNLNRENLFGAYFENELIGFVMLADAGRYALITQILSKIGHRDKATANALIAGIVQFCAENKIAYLVYAKWEDGSLADFKRHNGFQKIDLPRYYIPLTLKGKIALALNLHHGFRILIPPKIKKRMINICNKMYLKKHKVK